MATVFTIIIPTHDRPLLLQRALRSLISQTYVNFHVIVVDDSSTYIPPYAELNCLQGRYTYVLRSGVPGPAESRNMALALADSEYIIFLDDDDIFEAEHLQGLADFIQVSSPELVFCDFKVRYEDRSSSPPEQLSTNVISLAGFSKNDVYVLNRIPNNCLAYRKDVLAGKFFETDLIIYEDWDFLLKCLGGRELQHVGISSVVIHKTDSSELIRQPNARENMRRGNTRDDKIAETMLYLYRTHAAPSMDVRLARQTLLNSAGMHVALELC